MAYEGVSLLDLAGPLEALRVASTHPNHVGASLIYKCSVLSVHGGLVMTADGVGIATEPVSGLDGHTIDTLIVPGACDVDDVRRDRKLIDWVRDRGLGVGASAPSVSGRSCWQKPGCSTAAEW